MNILLTGSTSGIGWETFKDLWKEGHQMLLPVRNMEKAKGMLEQFGAKERVVLFEMDLSSLKSVDDAVSEMASRFESLDIIICNAGGMYKPTEKSIDKIDLSFSVNHLGHYALVERLISKLVKLPKRVISVSSEAHRISKVNSDDLGLSKSSTSFSSYANVKLYNILFTKSLKAKYGEAGLEAYALHPGAVRTSFGSESGGFEKAIIEVSKLFFISPKKGAQTTLYLCKTQSKSLVNGGYYKNRKLKSSSGLSMDSQLAQKLWEFSEKEVERILG